VPHKGGSARELAPDSYIVACEEQMPSVPQAVARGTSTRQRTPDLVSYPFVGLGRKSLRVP